MFLPKFNISTKLDVKNILKQMTVGKIFDKNCSNFDGITETDIEIDNIIQKAYIDVSINLT